MWEQIGASIATFLTIGGFVIFVFSRQGRRMEDIAAKTVTKEACIAQHKVEADALSELKEEALAARNLLHEVHVMVERIDATMNGGKK